MTLTTAFAANNEKNNTNAKAAATTTEAFDGNYDMRINYGALSNALRLNSYQREMLELVHDRFVIAMRKAGRADEALRDAKVRKAANTELKNMSYVLDRDQYRKFNTLLNVTLLNRGLLK